MNGVDIGVRKPCVQSEVVVDGYNPALGSQRQEDAEF